MNKYNVGVYSVLTGVDVAVNITDAGKYQLSIDVMAIDGQLINIGKDDKTAKLSIRV